MMEFFGRICHVLFAKGSEGKVRLGGGGGSGDGDGCREGHVIEGAFIGRNTIIV